MTYRVQVRDHLGVVNRAFGGRVVHRTPWRVQARFEDQDKAIRFVESACGRGLRQYRILYGKAVVKSWL